MMEIPSITVEKLEDWFQEKRDIVFLDVREPREHEICRFEQTTHAIPVGELPKRFQDLPKRKPIVVCCRSGVRSLYATRFLIEEGYDETYNLKGGILEYIRHFKKDWRTY